METGWIDPLLTEDDWDVTRLRLDRDGPRWRFAIEFIQRAAQESAGRSIPTLGALGASGDTLAYLRGTERLLYDVILSPERVREAERTLMAMWIEVYEQFYGIVHHAAGGSTAWFPLWSPGRFYPAQCDFSYLISPRMFNDLFLPPIERQTQYLDHTVYHVDGIDAFRHVPALLELPRLQALQILPGAGKPSPLHYLDTLRLVQSKGRNLHITIPPEEVEEALKLLSARGLCIQTRCQSEEQARMLLANAEKWSRDR
jgi:5-methyltetrahydrofolate--homocysteine methyltransferase